jgi:hypothetical protein
VDQLFLWRRFDVASRREMAWKDELNYLWKEVAS